MWLLHQLAQALCPPPEKPAALRQAESCFTPSELSALRTQHCVRVLMHNAAAPAFVSEQQFLDWAGLANAAPVLQRGVCSAVRRRSGASGALSLDGVVVSKAAAERQDRQAAQDWAWDVLDPEGEGRVSSSHVEAVVLGCLALAAGGSGAGSSSADAGSTSNADAAAAIAAGACACSADAPGAPGEGLTRQGFARLCKTVLLVALPAALPLPARAGLRSAGSGAHSAATPRCTHPAPCPAPGCPRCALHAQSPALNASLTSLLAGIGRCDEQPAAGPAAAPLPLPASETSSLAGTASGPAGGRGEDESGSERGSHHSAARRSERRLEQQREAARPGPSSAALAAAAAAAIPRAPGAVLLPRLGWGLCSPSDGLLSHGWVWMLAASLAPALRIEWRLLYSSKQHGVSISTLLSRLADAAPTLLLVRDTGGALLGGIAHSPWQKCGSFYGDYAAAVFSLQPVASLYPASGANGNVQWCGIGFSQLPNGLGFGGQVGHFGVFVDATLDTGMSRPTATFASPSLSSSQTFQVDRVEAWLLAPPEEADTPGSRTPASSVSALDQAREDRKILQWAGVGSNYSAALGSEPPPED